MRLLHIISSMNPLSGGPSQGIRNLDKAMSDMGVVREVVCLDAPDSNYLGMDAFKIHAIGPARGPWCYGSQLEGWLKDNIGRFNIIIINGLWLHSSYATWKVVSDIKKHSPGKNKPRVLVMPHGMLDPYFQRAKDRKFKAVRNWIYWKLIENRVVNDADGLLFTCETELLLARESFSPYRPRKEYNVGYGIEPPPLYHQGMSAAFNDRCPGLNGAPYLLFLSRIHPKKGIDLLIKAYINLYKSLNIADGILPKLVIAGPGFDTRFGKMLQQELVKTIGTKTDIFFTDMLVDDAKWGAFYGCEAFVLPSHQENFGIAVVEALACSKPVLISNQVNIWREIMAEKGGIIEDDNLIGVENMLKQWISLNSEEKAEMSKKAKRIYQNQFALNKTAANFLDAFKGHD